MRDTPFPVRCQCPCDLQSGPADLGIRLARECSSGPVGHRVRGGKPSSPSCGTYRRVIRTTWFRMRGQVEPQPLEGDPQYRALPGFEPGTFYLPSKYSAWRLAFKIRKSISCLRERRDRVACQQIHAFQVTRTSSSGSWIGRPSTKDRS